MRRAGVNLVSLGIFAWARLEPAPGGFEFGWLDRVIDLLHEHGVSVNLATPTASPPPWLVRRHPEILPVTAEGVTLWHGSRRHYCPHSAAYREGRAPDRRPSRGATRGTRRWCCGTSTTSTPATSASASARPRPPRSGAGCASATRRSTASTPRGARRSGASITATGRRSIRPAAPRRSSTRASSSTGGGSPPTHGSTASTTRPRSCGRSRPGSR